MEYVTMKSLSHFCMILLVGFFLTGCSLSYDLNPQISSTAEYEQGSQKQKTIFVKDNRSDKQFIKGVTGLSGVTLEIANVKDPVNWLSQSLQQEFQGHGISTVTFTNDPAMEQSADATLVVDRYMIINSRKSGFHPYIAFHSFSGKIQSSDLDKTVISYFTYGKTPIWSMDEVQEPCFDMPAAILIKGIAAKVNHFALHYQMSDRQLDELNTKINEELQAESPATYLSVLELGQSNNPKAISYLKALADNSDTLIRACALSSFGMLGQEDTFGFLVEKYNKYKDIDRFMALKSIGDLGTAEALDLLKEARYDFQYSDELGFKYLVDLYLEADTK